MNIPSPSGWTFWLSGSCRHRFGMLWLVMLALPVGAMGQSNYATPYAFKTLAGLLRSPGYADGTGSAARFCYPWGLAVDGAGNIYVTDSTIGIIRKVTAAGVVTTLAGQATNLGSADGTGDAARFSTVHGVAVDASGNLYVADTGNHTIRKVTAAGVVTTLAGVAGARGYADGIGSAARFSYPRGVAVDGAGNVYVGEEGNYTVRKITVLGVVTTLAGLAGSSGSADGTGSTALFGDPMGVAVDGAGNVYVADILNCTIRKITAAGEVTTLAGQVGVRGSADGMGSAAQFYSPENLAVDGWGNVYVGDTDNETIRQITATGVVTTLAGLAGVSGYADGTGSAARFTGPCGVALDGAGNLYVADEFNFTIRKVTAGSVVTTLAGLPPDVAVGSADGTGTAAQFRGPEGVSVDSLGNVYVTDVGNSTVRRITSSGVVSTLAGLALADGYADGTGSTARFNQPGGVVIDGTGNVYVADTFNHAIRKITAAGVVTTLAGLAESPGSADGTGSAARFGDPDNVAVDSAGNIYVTDGYTAIRKITSAGVVSTLAGLAGYSGYADGTGSAARFDLPYGVAADGAGNVYVADKLNHTIRKITAAGVVTTLAGLAGSPGSADGTGSAARFNYPNGVAVDGAGNLYIADMQNHTIRKMTPAGVVTTLAGLAGVPNSVDGTGSAARFAYPNGVAVDGAGKVYVTDESNNTIRVGIFPIAPSILAQPQSQTVAAGGSAHFSVTGAGQPAPSYQWYCNGGAITAATSATLDLANVRASDAGSYVVVLTNDSGTITSSPAVLTVNTGTATNSSGGGAVEAWFVLAMGLLTAARMRAQAKNGE